jgi:hypothetical protein
MRGRVGAWNGGCAEVWTVGCVDPLMRGRTERTKNPIPRMLEEEREEEQGNQDEMARPCCTTDLEENVRGGVRVVPLRGPATPRSCVLLGLLDHCIAVFPGEEGSLGVVHQVLGVKRKVVPVPDNVLGEFHMLKVVIGKIRPCLRRKNKCGEGPCVRERERERERAVPPNQCWEPPQPISALDGF